MTMSKNRLITVLAVSLWSSQPFAQPPITGDADVDSLILQLSESPADNAPTIRQPPPKAALPSDKHEPQTESFIHPEVTSDPEEEPQVEAFEPPHK
jgi:hypothetical protein